MKQRMKIFGILLLVFLLIGCGKSTEKQIAEQLELAQRYLAELNYEEAIIAFNKIVEIDEKNVDAYFGLSQVYEAQAKAALDEQDFESVEKLLALAEEMYSKVQEINPADERLEELFAKVEELRNQVKEEKAAIERAEREAIEQVKREEEERMAKEKIYSNPIIQELISASQDNNIDKLVEIMRGDEYFQLSQDELVSEGTFLDIENNKVLGFSKGIDKLIAESLPRVMSIYFGDYNKGNREGQGTYLTYFNDTLIIADGEWEENIPNGKQVLTITYPIKTVRQEGYVRNGLWDGTVIETEIFDSGSESTSEYTFVDGQVQIIHEYVENGEKHYLVAYDGHTGRSYIDAYDFILYGIPEWGFWFN